MARDKEQRAAQARERYWRDVEESRKRQRDLRRGNEKYLQHTRNWKLAHPTADKDARAALRSEMLAAYGGACACCGENREAFLTLDHVNRDGAEHRRRVGNGRIMYDLRDRGWPQDGYRILCMNCNWATRRGDECPHQWAA